MASVGVGFALSPRLAILAEADALMAWPVARRARRHRTLWQPLIVPPCSRMRGCLRPSSQISRRRGGLARGVRVRLRAANADRRRPRAPPPAVVPSLLDGGIGPGCPVSCTDGGIAIPGIPGCVPFALLDGLVGYWRLNDGAGSTIATDLTATTTARWSISIPRRPGRSAWPLGASEHRGGRLRQRAAVGCRSIQSSTR